MAIIPPSSDGDVKCYNLTRSAVSNPRVYFVNGIRVLPTEHAVTAAYLSLLIERPVWGVYNKTAGQRLGSLVDLVQCLFDYTQNATARVFSPSKLGKPAKVTEAQVPEFLQNLEKNYVVWNKATLALFKELVTNRRQEQLIVAHSQGNLITSNALFVLEDVLGSAALRNIRVYSLASPSPGWPVSLSKVNEGGGRQDNAFMNDLVALLRPHNAAAKLGVRGFQNSGDFRTHSGAGLIGVEKPHNVNEIIETLNFLRSIRKDLHLLPDISQESLQRAARIADHEVNGNKGGASGSW